MFWSNATPVAWMRFLLPVIDEFEAVFTRLPAADTTPDPFEHLPTRDPMRIPDSDANDGYGSRSARERHYWRHTTYHGRPRTRANQHKNPRLEAVRTARRNSPRT